MLDHLTPQLAIWALLLLVPGFLMRYALSFFVSPKEDSESRNWLTTLALSGVNFIPLLVWIALNRKVPYVRNLTDFFAVLFLVFVFPFLVAAVFAAVIENKLIARLTRWVGLFPKLIYPTAWDYYFQMGRTGYVKVHLTDGGSILGAFGQDSVAGSVPAERDLYLEKTFDLDEKENWVGRSRSGGVLIKADQIAYIEFID